MDEFTERFHDWVAGTMPLVIREASVVNYDLCLEGDHWKFRGDGPFRVFDEHGRVIFSDSWWVLLGEDKEDPLRALAGDVLVSARILPGHDVMDLELKTKSCHRIELFDLFGCESWVFVVGEERWIW